MQKLLYFEIATAIKDRPKFFQVVILMLFAFSLTVIFVSSLTKLTGSNATHQATKEKQGDHYVQFLQTPSTTAVNLKK